jgi:hypothetical protein
MELTEQFVNSDTNKTAQTVIKLEEPLLGHSHVLWMDNFYNSGTLHVKRKNCSSLGESQKTCSVSFQGMQEFWPGMTIRL